jgi:hypothetical protein
MAESGLGRERLMTGWQYYTDHFYWEAYFTNDSVWVFNDVLNLILDTSYEYDEGTNNLTILKNEKPLFFGTIEKFTDDQITFFYEEGGEKHRIVFFKIGGNYDVGKEGSMIKHMKAFEDRKINFLEKIY